MISSPVAAPAARIWTRARTVNLIVLVALLAGFGVAFGQVTAYEAGITRQQFTIPHARPTAIFAWAIAAVAPIVQ